MDTGQLLAFGAGTFCLGITFTFGLISTLAARYSGADQSEGCFSAVVGLAALLLAAYFFILAL
jgi:hypothetical protein